MNPLYWEDVVVGTRRDLGSYTFTEEEIIRFARKYDPQSFHVDPEAAKHSIFGGLIASGWHTAAVWMKLAIAERAALPPAPRRCCARASRRASRIMKWLKPVRPGMTAALLRPKSSARRNSPSRPDMGLVAQPSTKRRDDSGDACVPASPARASCSGGRKHDSPWPGLTRPPQATSNANACALGGAALMAQTMERTHDPRGKMIKMKMSDGAEIGVYHVEPEGRAARRAGADPGDLRRHRAHQGMLRRLCRRRLRGAGAGALRPRGAGVRRRAIRRKTSRRRSRSRAPSIRSTCRSRTRRPASTR